MPFKHWKLLSAAVLTFTLPLTLNATPRPDHPTIIVSMDRGSSYIAMDSKQQPQLRLAVLLELSSAHRCGSNEVYLTPESAGIPEQSFSRALGEIQQLIDQQIPLLLTLSECDGKRAFFEKVRPCTPQECSDLTASLVDGKLYLDERYAPTGRGLASYYLTMPMSYDKRQKAWHAKVFYVESGTLRRDYFVNAEDFVSGKAVHASKTYYPDGQVGQSIGYDVNGKRQGEVLTYSESGVVIERSNYLDDLLEGWQTTYHDNGKVAESYNWHQDKRVDGEYLEYDENGKLVGRINYRANLLDGPITSYYPDGRLKNSGQFVAGNKVGPSPSYYPDGTLEGTVDYVDNQPVGWQVEYHPNGKVKQKQFNDEHGTQRSYALWNEQGVQTLEWQWDEQHREQGDFREWYDNGRLKDHKLYKDAKLQGPAVTWYENGQMKSSTDYLDGQEQGWMRFWNKDGSLQSECQYQAGARQGACS
ncbi:toxin-antitoxin system YwqK family antitoxin [Pseudomonas sp. SK3(2021)]|uniref:toxin-antitoxin system YwqK family antitoxin n=1 Tax=Pseudomonas sp. SK3(2021) TaxID=2841064 RepID=UPI00192B6124|nr:toxin-antitoxin system YwqK family antitoxin [Pseudomonas sp. SK3(2021)]QQZ43321.1 toxin-antitoxin system YwqK family antitoxin [Pseudomonas sp. SK3(2021)]